MKERKRHWKRENGAGRMLCVLRIQKCEEWKNKECFRKGKLQEGRERHSEKYLHSLCNQDLRNPLGLIQDASWKICCLAAKYSNRFTQKMNHLFTLVWFWTWVFSETQKEKILIMHRSTVNNIKTFMIQNQKSFH